jgi:cytochrome P450
MHHLPPGPRTANPLGFLGPIRHRILEFLDSVHREYGDIASFRVGAMRVVLLSRPDYIHEVLVVRQRNFVKGRPLELAKNLLGEGLLTSDGEVHKRQRRMVQPAFHREEIRSYGQVMTDYAMRLHERWRNGETVDMAQEMMRMALGISGKTMFNADVDGEAADVGKALASAMMLFDRLSIPLIEVMLKLPFPSTLRFRRAKKVLDSKIYRFIEEHRSQGTSQGDLLSLLLSAADGEDQGKKLTDQELRDQALIFFLAAYDTTALALTWTWYLLSQNLECEDALHEELASVLGGRIPVTDDLPNLKYTRAVFAEALRLFPPGYVLARRALEEFELDGYFIPRGATILLSPYLMHRDPRFHEHPATFDPTRWLRPPQTERPKFSYFPFGGGARVCIGDDFSWTEGILVLATLAQHWKARLVPGHPVACLPLLNLRPKYGMRMVLEKLSQGSQPAGACGNVAHAT